MNTVDCTSCRSVLPDLLLDPAHTPDAAVAAHLAICPDCRAELQDMRAIDGLLNEWTAPDPSPYFDARVRAHLREAENAAPESLWERFMATLRFSTGRGLRPAIAGAFLFVILLGGGTVATLWPHHGPEFPANSSPTVNDLRIYDNNAQALQQMDILDDAGADPGTAQPQS